MQANSNAGNRKRPSWDEYFIEIAKVVSTRSTCLRRNYGAVIVRDNIIISTGYNGSPRGEVNCIDAGKCLREEMKVPKGERYELCAAVHAEQNAIINGDPVKMRGAALYVAGFNADGTLASGEPCLLCRRMAKNALIERIVYLDEQGVIVVSGCSLEQSGRQQANTE
ncbi:MAG: cytidine deaminase [Peptococcaceae bacterium]|jgi:dCMP deaminase|nr:cytidine deaminase [Peptococcaceae bacterium]